MVELLVEKGIPTVEKTEFNLHQIFKTRTHAHLAVKGSINAYNNLRPHTSCDFLTPVEAHTSNQVLVKR